VRKARRLRSGVSERRHRPKGHPRKAGPRADASEYDPSVHVTFRHARAGVLEAWIGDLLVGRVERAAPRVWVAVPAGEPAGPAEALRRAKERLVGSKRAAELLGLTHVSPPSDDDDSVPVLDLGPSRRPRKP